MNGGRRPNAVPGTPTAEAQFEGRPRNPDSRCRALLQRVRVAVTRPAQFR